MPHALFPKFQNQVWHTSGKLALPIEDAPAALEIAIPDVALIMPWAVLPDDFPTHLAVTILNISAGILVLSGWSLLEERERRQPLSATIRPGATITIPLDCSLRLSKKGGTITLLPGAGLKVHGVVYTAAQVHVEGRPVVFH